MNEFNPELINRVEDRHKKNIEKWGHQNPELLNVVLMEEIGEVSKAYLQAYYGYEGCGTEDLENEIVDAMAVLVEFYQSIDKHDYSQ